VPTTNVYPQLAEAVKDMVADIGINLELVPTDPVQTAPVFYAQQQGDMLVSVWGGRHDPAQTLTLLFTPGPLQNPGGHSTPAARGARCARRQRQGRSRSRSGAVQEMVKEVVDEQMNPVLYLPTGPLREPGERARFQDLQQCEAGVPWRRPRSRVSEWVSEAKSVR
jgi:hypothetical protein